MNQIIAIVGMCGSGKSVAVDYFLKQNYKKVYFGGITLEKMQEKGIAITPDNEKKMREDLRKEYGMGAYALLTLTKIEEFSKASNVVLDGLYSWEELKILKEKFPNMVTIAIITDKQIRYDRLASRIIRPFNREDAIKRDISEIEALAKGGPIAYADYFAFNNGSKEELEERLEEILEDILI